MHFVVLLEETRVYRLFSIILLIIASGCATEPTVAIYDGAYRSAFGSDSRTIRGSVGGYAGIFLSAANEVQRHGWQIRIDGPCRSACALFADKARPNVCITARASFWFHMGRRIIVYSQMYALLPSRPREFPVLEPPPQSADIDQWVQSHGGYPEHGFLTMSAKDALTFWPRCTK